MHSNVPQKQSLAAAPQAIWTSRRPLMVALRLFLLVFAGGLMLVNVVTSILPLLPPVVYRKDFIQEWLLARAVLTGVNPYQPLPDLAAQFLGSLPFPVLAHPTPHPPPVIFVALPFGLVSYPVAASLWFMMEVLCLGLAIFLLLRYAVASPKPVHIAFVLAVLLLWRPFKDEIDVGQLMSLLLLLLVGAFLLLRRGKDPWGGALLGLTLALKLLAWPIIVYLVLRRNWKAVLAAGTTFGALNLLAAGVMGINRVVEYYTVTGGQVAGLYYGHERNFSAWSLAYRVFQGTGSPITAGIESAPLIDVPALAGATAWVLPLAVLVLSMLWAWRSHSLESAFGILTGTTILVNPVAWSHYLVLAALPLFVAGRMLLRLNGRLLAASAATGLGLYVSVATYALVRLLAGAGLANDQATIIVSAPLAMLTLAPGLAVLSLMWLIGRLDRETRHVLEEAEK